MRVSTLKAARLTGIGQATLQRWVKTRKLKAPKLTRVGGVPIRLWSKQDVARIRRHKKRFYGQGKGRRTDLHGK